MGMIVYFVHVWYELFQGGINDGQSNTASTQNNIKQLSDFIKMHCITARFVYKRNLLYFNKKFWTSEGKCKISSVPAYRWPTIISALDIKSSQNYLTFFKSIIICDGIMCFFYPETNHQSAEWKFKMKGSKKAIYKSRKQRRCSCFPAITRELFIKISFRRLLARRFKFSTILPHLFIYQVLRTFLSKINFCIKNSS